MSVEKIFPSRLRFLREQANLTKTDVQRILKIKSLSTYANWEYGYREPDHETLVNIAKLFNVSVDYLLGNETEDAKRDSQYLEAIGDAEFRRWLIGNFSQAKTEELLKLRIMWEMLMAAKDEGRKEATSNSSSENTTVSSIPNSLTSEG